MKQWDVFISHASEDKETFVEPLAVSLASVGIEVWYDKFTLTLGDSLSANINEGLANSRFGIVVVGPAFLSKAWPAYELAGLVTREISSGKTILPLWHNITREQIVAKNPTLADKLAVRTMDLSLNEITLQILQVVRPDLYSRTDRSSLIKQLNGEALREIRQELHAVKSELNEYFCPDCRAPVIERRNVNCPGQPIEHYRHFACGRMQMDDAITDLCPSSPQFPRLEDLPIAISQKEGEEQCLLFLDPRGQPGLWLNPVIGKTEAHAWELLREAYDKRAKKYVQP